MVNKYVLGGVVLAGLLVWNKARAAVSSVSSLRFGFGITGLPTMIGTSALEIPISVTVENPGTVTLPLDRIYVTLERVNKDGSTYSFAATVPEGVPVPSIAAGTTTRFTIPVRTNTFDAVAELLTIWKLKLGVNKFIIRTRITTGGVSAVFSTPYTI